MKKNIKDKEANINYNINIILRTSQQWQDFPTSLNTFIYIHIDLKHDILTSNSYETINCAVLTAKNLKSLNVWRSASGAEKKKKKNPMGEDGQSIFVKFSISITVSFTLFSLSIDSFFYFCIVMGHHIKSFTDGSLEAWTFACNRGMTCLYVSQAACIVSSTP